MLYIFCYVEYHHIFMIRICCTPDCTYAQYGTDKLQVKTVRNQGLICKSRFLENPIWWKNVLGRNKRGYKYIFCSIAPPVFYVSTICGLFCIIKVEKVNNNNTNENNSVPRSSFLDPY